MKRNGFLDIFLTGCSTGDVSGMRGFRTLYLRQSGLRRDHMFFSEEECFREEERRANQSKLLPSQERTHESTC